MATYISQHGTKRGSSSLVGLPKKQNLLVGGKSDDDFLGGIFGDRFRGGAGADRFFYTSSKESRPGKRKADVIEDFNLEDGDRIVLSNDLLEEGKSRKFKFIGGDEFSSPGQIAYTKGNLKINLDSDKRPEVFIKLEGNPEIDESGFIYGKYQANPGFNLGSQTGIGAPIPGWPGGFIGVDFSINPKLNASVQTWFDGKSVSEYASAAWDCAMTSSCPPLDDSAAWGFTFNPSIELSGSITLTAGPDPYSGSVLIPSYEISGPKVSDGVSTLGTGLSLSGNSDVDASGPALGKKHVISYKQDLGFALKGNGKTGFAIDSATSAPSVSINQDSLTGLSWTPTISQSIGLSGSVGVDLTVADIGAKFEMLSLGGAISINQDFSISKSGSSMSISETVHPTGSVGKCCVEWGVGSLCGTVFQFQFPSDMKATLYGPETHHF